MSLLAIIILLIIILVVISYSVAEKQASKLRIGAIVLSVIVICSAIAILYFIGNKIRNLFGMGSVVFICLIALAIMLIIIANMNFVKEKFICYTDEGEWGHTDINGVCISRKPSKYGSQLDNKEYGVVDEEIDSASDDRAAYARNYGNGSGSNDVDNVGQKGTTFTEVELKKMESDGICKIINSKDCVSNNPMDADNYCKRKNGNSWGFTTKVDNICCPRFRGDKAKIVPECKYGYIQGKKYSDSELISMTQCLPVTTNFNVACQYNNPPCAKYLNDCECEAATYGNDGKKLCKWNSEGNKCVLRKDSPYKYSNYGSNDFGYKSLLIGKEGACYKNLSGDKLVGDKTMGRAICSPDFHSGIRKVPDSTNCQDMDSKNFSKTCSNEFGLDQNKLGTSNSFGCMDDQTRKICTSNLFNDVNYIGCFYTPTTEGLNIQGEVNNVKQCIDLCNKKSNPNNNFKYIAVFPDRNDSTQCACEKSLENITKYGNKDIKDQCNIPCKTGKAKCGGYYASSVYKI